MKRRVAVGRSEDIGHRSSKRKPNEKICTSSSFHQCDQCALTWKKSDVSHSFFELKCESRHKLCPLCFSAVMAAKGSMHFFLCPTCKTDGNKEKLLKWEVFAPQCTSSTRRGEIIQQRSEMHELAEPDATLQPVLHHHATAIMKAKDGEQADDKPELTTLSFATTKKNKEGNEALQAISVQINKENIDTTINKKDKKKIITIFQLLHPILVAASKKEFQQKYESSSISSLKLLLLTQLVFFIIVFMLFQLARSLHQHWMFLSLNPHKRKIFLFKFLPSLK